MFMQAFYVNLNLDGQLLCTFWFDVLLLRVGLVFCGRQSPGGHNVIWGLHDALKVHNPNSTLLGFLGK